MPTARPEEPTRAGPGALPARADRGPCPPGRRGRDTVGVTGPASPRWTHVALPCADLDATLDWYGRYTPLALLDRRHDDDGSAAAWLGHPDADPPFILVLIQPAGGSAPGATLAPFAHLGIELSSRDGVDAVAARAEADGCLHWRPMDLPAPIGYLCAVRDPDGNVIEFSHGQGVYDKAREVWGPAR